MSDKIIQITSCGVKNTFNTQSGIYTCNRAPNINDSNDPNYWNFTVGTFQYNNLTTSPTEQHTVSYALVESSSGAEIAKSALYISPPASTTNFSSDFIGFPTGGPVTKMRPGEKYYFVLTIFVLSMMHLVFVLDYFF